MHTFILWIHVITCFALVIIVLLQGGGKGAAIGSTFGGSSQTVFGTSGPASILSKVTALFAVVFMCTALYLAFYSPDSGMRSVVDDMETVSAPPTGVTDSNGGSSAEVMIPIGGTPDAAKPEGAE